jgi:hypothetical protein
MGERLRYELSAAILVLLVKGAEISKLRRKGAG